MTGRYAQPVALRRALEDRLKRYSRDRGLPLDRVRKEAAFQRLLARITAVAPADSWALKGGQAMIARSSQHARATADADATWRTDANQLQAILTTAVGLDLDDHFQFLLASPTNMRGEGPEGAIRFPIQARLAGRMFEPLHLDLNLVPGDTRPIEKLALHNLFDFAHLPAVVVPAVSPAQQLAEKLHVYARLRHHRMRVESRTRTARSGRARRSSPAERSAQGDRDRAFGVISCKDVVKGVGCRVAPGETGRLDACSARADEHVEVRTTEGENADRGALA